jgi:hypothetical protein
MSSETSEALAHKRVGIIQSNYIPWKGYFDFIASVDEFVFLDDVQYTRRDWRNRNRIKTQRGLSWLTIPVDAKGNYLEPIDRIRIADPNWVDEHLGTLRHAYARAAHFKQEWEWIEPLYRSVQSMELLSAVNRRLTEGICRRLNIETPFRLSRDVATVHGKNERLLAICRALGATEYLSGPAARPYIDETAWNAAGIKVLYKSYEGYPEYPQLHGTFEHHVTVLDVLFNTGNDAQRYLTGHESVAAR